MGGKTVYSSFSDSRFQNNLMMVDSMMPRIVSEMLLAFYSNQSENKKCTDLLKSLIRSNPIELNTDEARIATFYEHKVKELLCAVALGMTPATPWSGMDDANGGYIVAKKDGEVVTYYIYQRNTLKKYLLNSTGFVSPSRGRYNYGTVYKEDGKMFIKLNMQIRFK
jgi:type II restriction enzyme